MYFKILSDKTAFQLDDYESNFNSEPLVIAMYVLSLTASILRAVSNKLLGFLQNHLWMDLRNRLCDTLEQFDLQLGNRACKNENKLLEAH